jgi:hypothetical protein
MKKHLFGRGFWLFLLVTVLLNILLGPRVGYINTVGGTIVLYILYILLDAPSSANPYKN